MRFIRYALPAARNFAPALGGFSRSAWSGLETEIDRLFETAVGGATAATRFPVDLYEDKANTFVRAELPGVKRADINVDLVDGVLNITAARKTPPAAEGQAEQTVTLSRSVRIADEVQADNVAATYENGVLTVTLPKRQEAKPKKFTVEVK
ncbi:MAG: Hsp20/alpha crystallin family protein [Undibacterium sp.]|nr:Hsp20/alpha crystallin family protein [Opitutaceae bacterium]